MKNALKAVGVIALTGLLLLAGCADIFTPEVSKSQAGEGTVRILIGDAAVEGPAAATRNLVPDSGNFTAYGVSAAGSSTVVLDPLAGTTRELTLQPGSWTITVTAYTGTSGSYVASAKGSATVIVVAGQTATANITLNETADPTAPGTFHYSVNFGDVDFWDLDNAALTLTPANGSGAVSLDLKDFAYNSPSATTKEGDITLASGIYTMKIQLTSGRVISGKTLNIYRQEKVYIFPGLTTTGAYTFSDSQLTAYVYLRGSVRLFGSVGTYKPTEVYVKHNSGSAGGAYYDSTDYAGIVRYIDTAPDSDGYYYWHLQVPSQTLQKDLTGLLDFSFKAEDSSGNVLYTPWSENAAAISINDLHGNEVTGAVLSGYLVQLSSGGVSGSGGTITGIPSHVFAGTYGSNDAPIQVTVTATGGGGNIVKPGSVYVYNTGYPLTFDTANVYHFVTVPPEPSATVHATAYDPTAINPLALNTWDDGSIAAGESRQYTFVVTAGQYYYAFLDDSQQPYGKSADMKITVASDTASISPSISDADTAWGTQFEAISSGNVSIIVEGWSPSDSGTYAVGISPSGIAEPGTTFTPLSINTWEDGSLGTTIEEDWYEFTVPSDGNYYLWLNNDRSNYGDGSKTAKVQVTAYKGTNQAGSAVDYYTSYTTGNALNWVTLYAGDKVYVRVSYSGSTGTYAVGITPDSNLRPGTVVTTLTDGAWENGEISASGNDWYAFTVPSDGIYYLWRNQNSSYGGDGNKNGRFYFYLNGSGVGSTSTNYYSSGYSFSANGGDTVYVRVAPYNTGTYAIGITSTLVPIGVATTSLIDGTWGSVHNLTTGTQQDWYTFTPGTDGYYYFWVNGSYNSATYGDSSLSGNSLVYISAQQPGYGTLLSELLATYNSSQSAYLYAGIPVYIKIRPYSGSTYLGEYKLVFSSSSGRP
ncbi:hypothetical protein FACS189450_12250 [Spirochaetia bacterium]|nr:hypothetical protein FACS189450_12250 [Spirochaetia bacterium]